MSRMLSKMNLISVVQQLPKEDIETIQGYVEMIEQENNIQKAMIENFVKENQELKKQLEKEYNKGYEKGLLDTVEEVQRLDKQQKEFIEYLENEINKIKEQIRNYDIWHEVGVDINFLILKKQFFIEILSKYQEITGENKC